MNFVYLIFLGLGWVWIELFIGGTRLLYSIPGYALIAVAALLSLAGIRRKALPPDPFCLGTGLILGAWILYRASHSPVGYLALPDFYMALACLLVYLLTAFYFGSAREQLILIWVLGGIAALEVWCAAIQFVTGKEFKLVNLMPPGIKARASGMFVNANSFAGFLVTIGILFLSLGVWSANRAWMRILMIYIAAVCWLGVAISGSRGGYFALLGALLCFAIASMYALRVAEPRKFLPVAVACLAGLVCLVGGATFLMGHSQFLSRRMEKMVANDPRIYNWQAAIDHFHVSPWIGTGAGTHLIYGRLFRRPRLQVDPVHAHCDYLELLAEYGIAGGACMALFLAAHIRNGIRSSSWGLQRLISSGLLQSNRFAIQLGALCAVAGLAVHSLTDFDMHIPGIALVFAFLFGVLANPGLERPLSFMDRRVTGWVRLLPPVLGAWMLWFAVPLLPSEYCADMARRSLKANDFLDAISWADKGLDLTGPRRTSPLNAGGWPSEETLDKLVRGLGPNRGNTDLFYELGQANLSAGLRVEETDLRAYFLKGAYGAFRAELKLFPEDENGWIGCGQALDGAGHFDAAEGYYRVAFAWDPKLDLIYRCYAGHLVAEGKKEEGEALEKRHGEPNFQW